MFVKNNNNKEKIEAQWKLVTSLSILKWRKVNADDKRTDGELAEQFMGECEKEGWCRKVDGQWQLKELKLNKKQVMEELKELGF
jgi:hypothetical protein